MHKRETKHGRSDQKKMMAAVREEEKKRGREEQNGERRSCCQASDGVWRKSLSAFYRLSCLLSVGGEASSSLLSSSLIHLSSSSPVYPQLERLAESVCVCVLINTS